MIFHVVGFTEREFFESVGSASDEILKVLRTAFAASARMLQTTAHDQAEYLIIKDIMEVRSVLAFDEGGLPAQFETYTELLYLNDRAFRECEAAGMSLKVVTRTAEPPENAGILLRLPVYSRVSR